MMRNWRLTTVHILKNSLDDLEQCGDLYLALVDQLDASEQTKIDQIVADAYANLAATSQLCWRRLHTDASILSALISEPLDAIEKLDTAIIISGATGEGRLELVLDIIQHIQSEHLPSLRNNTAFAPQATPPAAISGGRRGIPCLTAPPSLAAFQSRDHKTPFVLRRYARDWPALNERPWASTEYLRAVAGPGRVVPVEVGRDYRTDDWSQKIMSWDAFLTSLDAEDGPPHYLAQHSLLMQFPALRADIEVPDYVYADLPRPPECPPPMNDEQLVINAWLGPKGTVSPAHTDPYFNAYIQVAGHKTVWMAPPQCDAGMYAKGNTAGVDVFASDQTEHPLFGVHVAEECMTACLGPGDLLYMPVGWWHAMRGESCSFSVSMWF